MAVTTDLVERIRCYTRQFNDGMGNNQPEAAELLTQAADALEQITRRVQQDRLSERKQWNGTWFCAVGCSYWHDGFHVIDCRFVGNGARRGDAIPLWKMRDLVKEWRTNEATMSSARAKTYAKCARQISEVVQMVEAAMKTDAVDPHVAK